MIVTLQREILRIASAANEARAVELFGSGMTQELRYAQAEVLNGVETQLRDADPRRQRIVERHLRFMIRAALAAHRCFPRTRVDGTCQPVRASAAQELPPHTRGWNRLLVSCPEFPSTRGALPAPVYLPG